MTALLLVSIALLALGMAGSLVLMVRSGEPRVSLLALCLGLLAARQGIALWLATPSPGITDAAGWSEIALVAASVAGIGALFALWRTFEERDRAEALHWDSMEAVRVLGELAVRWDLSLDEKLAHLLRIGCERFGAEIGAVSRIEGPRYEVLSILAPDDCEVARGAVFLLPDTLCRLAFDSKRLVALERVAPEAAPAHVERAPFRFASYLGAPVRIFGEPVGTLCFGSRIPRRSRFSATDKDLANTMSLWVGTELERRLLAEEREAIGARESALVEKARPETRIARSVDVNLAIRRTDKSLRAMIGPDVAVAYALAGDLAPAIRLHVTVAAILESLTHHAAETLPGGGTLTIGTANLEVKNQNPNVIPAMAPDHYVTVTVTVAGDGIDAERISQAFDAAGAVPDRSQGFELQPHLTIAAIYRLLQRTGGDLSLTVEPGVNATFTVYLPRATTAARNKRSDKHATLPVRPA